MKYRLLLIYIIIHINVTTSEGQYYNTGQDPASLKWMQISTDHFKIIYPESYGQNGPDFARTLESSYKKLTSLFPEKKFKIPVIIHNNTIQSNGYVAWAPRRMEIHPAPEQSTIPLDPAEQLAIHEITHVLQMESLKSGFSRAASFLLGEQVTGAVSSLIPLWYFEGDAVFSESVLTQSGRGRSPSFQKHIKAIILENGQIYKYDKMLNGSFRNYVPDHYQSGFQMIAWSRSHYDHTIWEKALKFTGQQPFTLNPVNISLRNSSSLTKKKLFSQTFDTLKVLWKSEDTKSRKEPYEILNPPKNGKYISYFSPVRAGTDSIIAVRTSLSQPPCFVLINQSEKSEKRIFTPGHIYPYFISYGDGKIVWVELNPDPRWKNRNYSVIKMLDIKRNLVSRISRRSRYMSASVAPDGKTIAAVENTTDNRNYLVLIDAVNSTIIRTVPVPGNASLQRPEWSEKGRFITVINLTKEGEGVLKYDPGNQAWETLIEPGIIDIQSSSFRNDSLFFVSSRSGTENISLLRPDRSEVILTNSRFGATDLSIHGRNMMFTDYSSSGNNICYTTLTSNANGSGMRAINPVFLIDRFDSVRNNEPVAGRNDEEEYIPEPYSKIQHLFRFHSWMPFYADIDELTSDPQTLKPGLTLMTQNSLSTLISSTGYKYSDKRHQVHSKISWQGWYPVFDFNVNYGGEPIISKQASSIADPREIRQGLEYTGSISLPLVFSSGNFSQFIRPSFSVSYENNYIYIREEGIYDYGQPQLNGRFYFSNYSRSAARDIYPPWAQVIDLNYGFYPSDKDLFGDLANIRTAFYFPGIFNNQGIRFRYEADRQKFRRFYQSNRAAFPRGYLNLLYPQGNINIYSERLDFLSVDYAIPLVYPDFNLASMLYIKRIRTGLFYDFARGTNNFYDKPTPVYNRFTEDFSSFGCDLLADFYLLRIPFMITAGVQTAWRSIGTAPSFELLFNFDIFGMSIGKTPGN